MNKTYIIEDIRYPDGFCDNQCGHVGTKFIVEAMHPSDFTKGYHYAEGVDFDGDYIHLINVKLSPVPSYYIADIHPLDAFYEYRNELIGKELVDFKMDNIQFEKGWEGVTHGRVEGFGRLNFYAVKLTNTPPKKSFLQKLFTWSW